MPPNAPTGQPPRPTPLPTPAVVRVDDALPSALFRSLQRRLSQVGNERLASTYQTTFWFPLNAEAQCVPERCALALRAHLPSELLEGVIGVEWWLSRMRTTDVRVDFHQDRDEKLALQRGKTVHPKISSVLFMNAVRGGLLAVTSQLPREDNPSLAPDDLDATLVRPHPNRFAFFDGTLTHGVLDANNQIPDRRLPGAGRLRKTLIFNWWTRRPLDIPQWSESRHYRSF